MPKAEKQAIQQRLWEWKRSRPDLPGYRLLAVQLEKSENTVRNWFSPANFHVPDGDGLVALYRLFQLEPNWVLLGIGKSPLLRVNSRTVSSRKKPTLHR